MWYHLYINSTSHFLKHEHLTAKPNGGRCSESGRCGCKFTDYNLECCDLTFVSGINLKMQLLKFTSELKSTMNGIVRMLKEQMEVMNGVDRFDSMDMCSHAHTQD